MRDCIIIVMSLFLLFTHGHRRNGQPTQQLTKGKVTPVHVMKVQGGGTV